jgi:probable phosphoglycerate mutase
LWAHWQRHDADYALPAGGESVRVFHQRVLRGVQRIVQSHPGRCVAVFTHGGVLDMLWRAAHQLTLHGARVCEIPNTGINRLRWRDGALQIVLWADAAHLEGLPAQPDTTPLGVHSVRPLDVQDAQPLGAADIAPAATLAPLGALMPAAR